MSATGPASSRLEVVLLRAARNVRRAFDARLRVIELNLTEASMLSYLRDLGPMSQRELADHVNIGRAAAGEFVDVLERRGLVTKEVDREDKRAWKVSLTEAATPVTDEFDAIDAALRAELRDGLGPRERKQLVELLSHLDRNACRSSDPSSTLHASNPEPRTQG
jgi:MarR family transcriptional regulator for hemolysin